MMFSLALQNGKSSLMSDRVAKCLDFIKKTLLSSMCAKFFQVLGKAIKENLSLYPFRAPKDEYNSRGTLETSLVGGV